MFAGQGPARLASSRNANYSIATRDFEEVVGGRKVSGGPSAGMVVWPEVGELVSERVQDILDVTNRALARNSREILRSQDNEVVFSDTLHRQSEAQIGRSIKERARRFPSSQGVTLQMMPSRQLHLERDLPVLLAHGVSVLEVQQEQFDGQWFWTHTVDLGRLTRPRLGRSYSEQTRPGIELLAKAGGTERQEYADSNQKWRASVSTGADLGFQSLRKHQLQQMEGRRNLIRSKSMASKMQQDRESISQQARLKQQSSLASRSGIIESSSSSSIKANRQLQYCSSWFSPSEEELLLKIADFGVNDEGFAGGATADAQEASSRLGSNAQALDLDEVEKLLAK